MRRRLRNAHSTSYALCVNAASARAATNGGDGRCYERCAIEEWFVRQPQPQVKSPVTNEPMGKRLFPAVQLRNSLKRLVESGAISGCRLQGGCVEEGDGGRSGGGVRCGPSGGRPRGRGDAQAIFMILFSIYTN